MKKAEGLNIVPFIDILLVLLALILCISTFISQGHIPIDVPSSSHAQAPKDQKKLTISTDASNQLYIDAKPTTLQELKAHIHQTSPKTLIEIQNDKESRFDSFIQILNILKESRHENFVITTQKS